MQGKRNFGLDALRALAILSVFLGHGVTALAPIGVGVPLFFALSGFLVGRIYFRSHHNGTFTLTNFWVSRWWRTLPPYYVALGLFYLAERWIPTNAVDWHYLFFLQTFVGMKGFGPSWSLCIEEHFYLALPLLALAAEWIFGRKHLVWLIPVAFCVPTLLRGATIALVGGVSNMPHEWYLWTPFHTDALTGGVYMAYLYVEKPKWFHNAKSVAWVLAPIFLLETFVPHMLSGNPVFETFYMTLQGITCAAWLRLFIEISWEPVSLAGRLTERAIRGIALASYSIYLLHVLIMTDLHVVLSNWQRGAAKSIFILSVTFVGCILFYYLVERPSIITRDRYFAARKAAVGATSTV
jgi:peptidoglycan/LPS O-acetylase OafA/YrhL